jgi:SH3 domain-containing protein/AMIN domain-containing protein
MERLKKTPVTRRPTAIFRCLSVLAALSVIVLSAWAESGDSTSTLPTAGTETLKASPQSPQGHPEIDSRKKAPEHPESRPGNEAVVTSPMGNIRSAPSTRSKILRKLEKGSRINIIGKEGRWFLVELGDGRKGWAHEILFRKMAEPSATPTGTPNKIREIRFEVTSEGEEKVLFVLNNTIMPRTFEIKGARPRVVCDFSNAGIGKGVSSVTDVNGVIVKRIRAGVRREPRPRTRVVMDLGSGAGLEYEMKKEFFRDTNQYLLTFKAHGHEKEEISGVQPDKPAGEPENEIRSIRFEKTSEGHELVIFQLNGYHPPKIFAATEERPRVVCDFSNARLGKDVGSTIEVNGGLIRQIRVGLHTGSRPKVRVVLDLTPEKNTDYEIQPFFFEDDNRFTLRVIRLQQKVLPGK